MPGYTFDKLLLSVLQEFLFIARVTPFGLRILEYEGLLFDTYKFLQEIWGCQGK